MNIQQILDWHHIPYILSGKNVAYGNCAIKCPWCGYDDPSEHLGINLKTGYWACWRNQDHRGKKPHRLLMKLLNCSYKYADDLVATIDRTQWKQIKESPSLQKSENAKSKLAFPKEIKPLDTKGSSKRFRDYLERRGFDPVQRAIDDYGLRYSVAAGPWKDRLIVPINDANGSLVTWTGRSIHPTAKIKYKTLSNAQSIVSLKSTIWNYDQLYDNGYIKHLILVEGPFDALKLDFYGRDLGLRATCMFGLNITSNQIDLLSSLEIDNLHILLDSGTEQQALKLQKTLSFLRPKIASLPTGIDDPGNLSKSKIKYLRTTLKSV